MLQARSLPLSPALRSLRLLSVSPCHCGYPVSHLPYTLPSSVSRNFIACHSYENCRGAYQQFPTWNYLDRPNGAILQDVSSLPIAHHPLLTISLTPLSATDTRHPVCVGLC